MAQCADLHSQLIWKAIDINFTGDIFTNSESDTSRWGFRLLAIGIQCRPLDQTKVLNLGNQQWSDLLRGHKDMRSLLYRLIFHWVQ